MKLFNITLQPGSSTAGIRQNVRLLKQLYITWLPFLLLFITLVSSAVQAGAQISSCTTPSFAATTNFGLGAGNQPVAVCTGDFNKDGELDIATANYGTNNVSILLGNGTGYFSPAVATFSAGTNPYAIVAGDFNRDNKLDIATANLGSDNVSVLIGNGTGGFAAPVNFGVGLQPSSIVISDFNGDTNLDLATANTGSNNVTVLLGAGNGSFTSIRSFRVGSSPLSVTTGDLNGDSYDDLVVSNATSNSLSVLVGNGSGSFATATSFSVGFNPYGVTTGDYNRDGKIDAVVGYRGGDSLSLVLGNGAGGFTAITSLRVGTAPWSVKTGDFNGDGILDLATANSSSSNVSVLLGNGAGGFTPATNYNASTSTIGVQPFAITIGDINGDRKSDLVTSNTAGNNVSVLLNTCNFQASTVAVSGPVTFCAGGSVTLTATPDFTPTSYRWSNGATTRSIQVTTSGSYTVVVKNSFGYISAPSAPVVVTVNPVPTVTLSPAVACGGTLTASLTGNVRTIDWKLNGNTVYTQTDTTPFSPNGITVAGGNGNGSNANQLYYPYGIFVNGIGEVFVTDYFNHRIQKWSPGATSGITVAGGNGVFGGTEANQLSYPFDVFVDANSNVFVADYFNGRIQKWAPGAISGTTVAGGNGGGQGADKINNPSSVFVDANGNIYVSDNTNNRVQRWAPGATSGVTVAGGNGYGSMPNQLAGPQGIFIDRDSNVYVADVVNNRIQKWAPGATSGITVAGGNGDGNGANQLSSPEDVYVDADGNVFAADKQNNRIQKWAPGATSGTTVAGGNGAGAGANQINGTTGLFIDASGNLYVSDLNNARVQKFTKSSLPPTVSYAPTAAGNYTAIVTENAGCTARSNTAAFSPMPATPTVNVTQPDCSMANGFIVITTPRGGDITYSIIDSVYQASPSFINVAPGNYKVTVKNSNGCISAITPVTINPQPATPGTPTVTIIQPTCSVSTGSITVNTPTGTEISYSINGSVYQTSPTFYNLTQGSYSVTAKIGNGCVSSVVPVAIIAAPARPATPTVRVAQPACGDSTGAIFITVPTGSGLSYSINGITYQASNLFFYIAPGNYTVTVKNSSGCVSASVPVTINTAPPIPATPVVSVVQPTCTAATGTITVNSPVDTGITYSIDGTNYGASNVFNNIAPGNYNVTVRSSNGCVSAATPITINPQPTTTATPVVNVTQPACTIATGSITVNSPTGADITYSIGNTNYQTSNVFSNVAPGNYNVTAKGSNGCVSASAPVTINPQPATPAKPTITTSGPTTFPQGSSVTLTAPAGFTAYQWSNGAITRSITVTQSGIYTVRVTNNSGCTSPASDPVTVTVTVPLSVSHLDGDNGQLTNNNIRPYLQLNNEGSTPVSYSSLTIRYWLTVEDFAPMTNLVIDYAQLGTNKVTMKYVKLPQPRAGAFGYIEYTFAASAGNLAANSNSGPIQSRAGKSNWTNFNEADDYSYKSSTSYTKNNKITLYQNGTLVWGTEPAAVTPVQSLKVYSQDKSNGTITNTISHYTKVNNEGNTPVSYRDITVRYWFTADGTQPLNYYLDYAELGNSNITSKFVRLSTPLNGADTYLELGFTATDSLYPISTTGNLQQRIAKSDWSNFNQGNDHSYKPGSTMSENIKMTVYVKGMLVYGTEPTAGAIARSSSTASVTQPAMVSVVKSTTETDEVLQGAAIVYPNPNRGRFSVQLHNSRAAKADVQIIDARGIVVESRKALQGGGKSQTISFNLNNPVAGTYLVKIVSNVGVQVLKMIVQP